jgi:hypothetical protein
MQLIDLAHGVVEDAGDDAAVAVAGRSGVALAKAEFADEGSAFFVEDELEFHAVGVVRAADKAAILLRFVIAGFVAVGLGLTGHAGILRDSSISFEALARSPSAALRAGS